MELDPLYVPPLFIAPIILALVAKLAIVLATKEVHWRYVYAWMLRQRTPIVITRAGTPLRYWGHVLVTLVLIVAFSYVLWLYLPPLSDLMSPR